MTETNWQHEETIPTTANRGLNIVTDALGAILTLTCVGWALEVPSYLGTAFYNEQFLALVVGLAVAVAFLSISWRRKPHGADIPWLDVFFAALMLGLMIWVSTQYERLLNDVPYYTNEVVGISILVIPLVLEALRRCTGWALLSVVLVFIAYAMVAHLVPEALRGKPADFISLVTYLAFDTSAMFGSPMKVGATVVIVFLWMGDSLVRAGGGEFFKDIAMAFLGHRRGGPAKICVVGSALFGMISGSAVSNVASIGSLTIPMMIRTGYSRKDAGAIEAVGSTGGQLMPPVMGAAAFLMAEFLELPYAEIAIAAAIPAALYYLALYWQVDLIAAKTNLARMTGELPRPGQVMREGWHFIVPIVVLVIVLFNWSTIPELAAIGATITIFVVGMVRGYRGARIGIPDIYRTLSSSGRTSADLFMSLAAAGFVIGVLNLSGLGFALTLWLVSLAGASMLILLLIAALVSLVLGMGMPTSAVYVLLAVLAGPSLIEAGVMKIAAHMFILYFGMLSMITPPVALAAFAAANISRAGPMETGWAACRIGWAKFILPFMFVLSPTLLMHGPTISVIYDTVTAGIGIYLVTAGLVGYFRRSMPVLQRIIVCIAGFAAIVPDSHLGFLYPGLLSGIGVLVGVAILASEVMLARRHSTA